MFGGTSSPGIYDRFAGLFLFLCVRKTRGMESKDAVRYLDDVMAVGPNGSKNPKGLLRPVQSNRRTDRVET